MISILWLTLLGFFLGMRHASDPDHVIAVSTIVSRQSRMRTALLVGSLWGVGHAVTIVIVGGAIVLFTVVISPRLGLSMEMAVAVMLIVLGMWNLSGILGQIRGFPSSQADGPGPLHAQLRGHGDDVRSRAPGRGARRPGHRDDEIVPARADRRLGGLGAWQILRPLIVGLVHGLAGSAAVALLVLALITNPWWAMAYLVLFGVGTIAGMMLITAAVGAALCYASKRSSRIGRYLRPATGLLSLGFGLFLAYQIAVVDGLIIADPGATP